MSKLTVELVQSKLLKENEEKRAKYATLKLSSNRGAKEVGKPADPSKSLTKITQIDVPGDKKLSDSKGADFIPTADRADKYVDKMGHMGMSTSSNQKSPKGPSVKSLKPNQTQKQTEVKSPIKNTEEGSNPGKTSLPASKDASAIVSGMPRGMKNGSDAVPTVKAPKAKDLGSTTKGKTTTVKTNFADKDGKKVSQVNHSGGFSKDESDAMSRNVKVIKDKGKSHNVVESGVIVKLGGKTKAVFDIVNRDVLNKIAESYARFGYKIEIERTPEAAWKKDKQFLSLLRESIAASYNFVPTAAAAKRKEALNRFHTLAQKSYNEMYESRQSFVNTVVEAFNKIEEIAKQKYVESLELMHCTARFIKGDDIVDTEITTEATDHQMALRQVRNTIMEEFGLDTKIRHIFVDGTKYTPAQIKEWTSKV